jgi:Xaa-Pro aminopeptidase
MTNIEYINRRKSLADRLGKDAIAIISAGTEKLRNGDAHYRFRQNSDFFYLTGSNEPEGLLLVSKEKSILFNRPRNPAQEQWTGPRLGQDAACTVLGLSEAYPMDSISAHLSTLLANKQAVYYSIACDEVAQNHLFKALESLKNLQRKGIHP